MSASMLLNKDQGTMPERTVKTGFGMIIWYGIVIEYGIPQIIPKKFLSA